MTKAGLNVLCVLSLVASGCAALDLGNDEGNEGEPIESSEEIGSTTSEIIEGYDTTINNHPWQVSLQVGGNNYCGGSILNANWIVTAAHCAQLAVGSYQIAAGMTRQSDVGTIGQLVNVSQIIVHPDYVGATSGNDVAVMQLATPLDLTPVAVSTIGLATEQDRRAGLTDPGVYSSATGWGRDTTIPTNPDILQEADMPIIANYAANEIMEDGLGLSVGADMIATGYVDINREGPCHGDSGGPLAVPNAQGNGHILAGLVSWGQGGCTSDAYPVLYARVSDFEPWIRQQLSCVAEAEGGWSYCSPGCPCPAGKGDCDSDNDCAEGTHCEHDVGANYGLPASLDVCEPNNCDAGPNGGWNHCTADCPCDIGEGDCDTDAQCMPGLVCKDNIGANYGFDASVDVCERDCTTGTAGGWSFASSTCPGGPGEGDCDSDAQCAPGLFCNHDVGADYGWDPIMDVCESRNLLSNASADSGTADWNVFGPSGSTSMTVSDKSVFYVEADAGQSAHLWQDVVLPKFAANKYLVFIGYGWVEHTVPNSITRHPYLYAYEMDAGGSIMNYLQGQNMRHTAATRTWQTMDGIFQISAGADKIRFFLRQASQVGDALDGTQAVFDDVGLMIFDTLAEAEEYRDYYTTTHPVVFE